MMSPRRTFRLSATVFAGLILSSCSTLPTADEIALRSEQGRVAERYRSTGGVNFPQLSPDSPLQDYLLFALLKNPRIEAAYYEWLASIERVTIERSPPDPRLTLEADISSMLMSLMAGLMVDLPGPGKLSAAAKVASEESRAKFHMFEQALVTAAYELKESYYQLYFLEERIRINGRTMGLLSDLEKLTESNVAVGKGSLQDVLRSQIERERLSTEVENLVDSRNVLLAKFKGALGLPPAEPAPPIPQRFEPTTLAVPSDQILEKAFVENSRLKELEAEIRQADARIRLAYLANVPDFAGGVEVDLKPSTPVWNPQFSITLPLWRDKIAAGIAEARAGRSAAGAKLSSEQIMLAIEVAERSFTVRQSDRLLNLFEKRLLPKARQSLDVARSGYLSGEIRFLDVIDAERTLLDLELSRVQAEAERELALARLSLVILNIIPDGISPASTEQKIGAPR